MTRKTINEDLSSYFPHACVVEGSVKTIDETGDQIEVWTTFASSNASLGSNVGEEEDESRQEIVKYTHLIVLNGDYDVQEDMRATINSIVYDIRRVIHDQLAMFTMLKVEKVI